MIHWKIVCLSFYSILLPSNLHETTSKAITICKRNRAIEAGRSGANPEIENFRDCESNKKRCLGTLITLIITYDHEYGF